MRMKINTNVTVLGIGNSRDCLSEMDRQVRDCHRHLDIWCNPIKTQVPCLSLTNIFNVAKNWIKVIYLKRSSDIARIIVKLGHLFENCIVPIA